MALSLSLSWLILATPVRVAVTPEVLLADAGRAGEGASHVAAGAGADATGALSLAG